MTDSTLYLRNEWVSRLVEYYSGALTSIATVRRWQMAEAAARDVVSQAPAGEGVRLAIGPPAIVTHRETEIHIQGFFKFVPNL